MKRIKSIMMLIALAITICQFSAAATDRAAEVGEAVKDRAAEVDEAVKERVAQLESRIQSLDSISQATVVVSHERQSDRGMFPFKDRQVSEICDMIISIIAILAVPLAAIIILLIVMHSRRRRLLDKYAVIESAMRSGYELPEEFFTGQSRFNVSLRTLHSALIWIACGATLMISFIVADSEEMAALMTLPMFVGVAKLIVYFVGRHQLKQKEAAEIAEHADADQA